LQFLLIAISRETCVGGNCQQQSPATTAECCAEDNYISKTKGPFPQGKTALEFATFTMP